jgi:hypothetical protein
MALAFALGGTGYAAFKLPRGSVTTASIRNGAVTSSKVRDGTLRGRDFAAGTLLRGPEGPAGPSGAQGPQGPPGDAPKIAYAHVVPNLATNGDTFTMDQAKGITKANIDRPGPFNYCFHDLPFQPANVQVTVDNDGAGEGITGYPQAHVAEAGHCSDSTPAQATVDLMDPFTEDDGWELGFYVTFFG